MKLSLYVICKRTEVFDKIRSFFQHWLENLTFSNSKWQSEKEMIENKANFKATAAAVYSSRAAKNQNLEKKVHIWIIDQKILK